MSTNGNFWLQRFVMNHHKRFFWISLLVVTSILLVVMRPLLGQSSKGQHYEVEVVSVEKTKVHKYRYQDPRGLVTERMRPKNGYFLKVRLQAIYLKEKEKPSTKPSDSGDPWAKSAEAFRKYVDAEPLRYDANVTFLTCKDGRNFPMLTSDIYFTKGDRNFLLSSTDKPTREELAMSITRRGPGTDVLFFDVPEDCSGLKLTVSEGFPPMELTTPKDSDLPQITQPFPEFRGKGLVEIKAAIAQNPHALEAKTDSGQTMLYRSVDYGHKQSVALLLNANANPNVQDNRGFTPLHRAALWGWSEILKMLIKKGGKIDAANRDLGRPLLYAAESGQKTTVEILLNYGADVNAANKNGITPLHNAALNGHREVLNLLIKAGADVNAKAKQGVTPLHNAVTQANKDVVKALLKAKANPNLQNEFGATPLHYAAFWGRKPIVEILLDHGADPDLKDQNGLTALEYAKAEDQKEIVELLQEKTKLKP